MCSYHSIMTSLVKLKEQREQALADLKGLETQRQKSEEDPREFLKKLFDEGNVIPRRQTVHTVPAVDFALYESLPVRPGGSAKPELPKTPVKRAPATSAASHATPSTPKNVPNNTPWTAEEQHRLEQLLQEIPDEPIAAHRYERIARALGNRTTKQVTTRILRYFERLARAGLPVPGRLPTPQNARNSAQHSSSASGGATGHMEGHRSANTPSSSHRTNNVLKYGTLETPVQKMTDILHPGDDSDFLTPEEKAAFTGLEHTEAYRELIQLKRFKSFQARSHENYVMQEDEAYSSSLHQPSKASQETCASCGSHISGNLFSCAPCAVQGHRVALCGSCHQNGAYSNDFHLPSHSFVMEHPVEFVDSDYALTDDMAYLDPNFARD